MLWLAAYLTGFPPVGLHALCWTHGLAPGNLQKEETQSSKRRTTCQCPLGLILHFYKTKFINADIVNAVSMPSRAYTSFLLKGNERIDY